MKKYLLFILTMLLVAGKISAQAPTNNADFTYLGKNYTAKYDATKHMLTFSEEISFEVYNDQGDCVKRGEAKTVDFRALLKGGGEKTFTVKLYKKAKKSKKKNSSIKQKGEIGTMLVTDSISETGDH